jgi:RND family efflux transporter MFP subunit
MAPRRHIASLILLLAIGSIGYFWKNHAPLPPPVGGGDNDEDDQKFSPVVPVSVVPITKATLHGYITASGLVEPEPGAAGRPPAGAEIRVPIASLVADVNCVQGQHVDKGQLLFTLDARDVDAGIERARKKLATADENVARFDKASDAPSQWRLNALRDRDQAQVELDAAVARQGLLKFTAPLSGTISSIQIRPGEVADPSTPAMVIADLDRLVIEVNVTPWQLHEIKPGQPVEILRHTPAETQPTPLTATVTFVDSQIDPKTGMGQIDVSVPSGSNLRPGEFAVVRIIAEEHKDCLTVPESSVVRNADGPSGIYVAVRDLTRSFRHVVKVGLTDGDRVEIEGDGLQAGEFVVTDNAHALPDKSKIEVSK